MLPTLPDEIKAPQKKELDVPKFTSSAMVYFNNSKQRSDLNPYYEAMERNPDVYYAYFPFIAMTESEGKMVMERETMTEAMKSKMIIEAIQEVTLF